MFHISIDNCSCASANGAILFSSLSTSISDEIVGLVGRNGSGKTTLLEVVAGLRQPATGSVTRNGKVGMMPQLSPSTQASLAEALDLTEQLAMHARIEAGEAEDRDFDQVDWSLHERLERSLERFGLAGLELERSVDSLSGGERTRLRLAHTVLSEPDILLLDEPTNDLDRQGRQQVAELLAGWNGPALVASHDRWLLERVDRIIELSPAGVLSVGGGWSAFVTQRDAERARAETDLEAAERGLKQAERQQQERSERQAQRSKQGKHAAARRGDSRLEINVAKQRAAKTSARSVSVGEGQVEEAQSELQAKRAQVEQLMPVRIELPKVGLRPGRVVLSAQGIGLRLGDRSLFGPLDLSIMGPERIALTGPNGSGKTSLIRLLTRQVEPASGSVQVEPGAIAVLDQHLSLLKDDETALTAIRRHNPSFDENQAYTALAAFGFRNVWAQRVVSTLSGGEAVRLALACLFSRPSPPQLLILDEPTNHLDIPATELLEQALNEYDGAILCVSHDQAFRERIGLTREIRMGLG